ncbi:beta-1,3-galactosyltransferase 1-like [Mercenaria mercenaria]|uniref:beta-1,3-galactosyltransferase 1-like n=1 Tax=Mercenaria mercenaria TaxID=6596 RepID=UPI001E1DD82D|nr:beta-1,3-galactosyltransferase 1-like [Mercenaria mercenaria]XP_045163389.1 beta-1,3-galactosyltransferase 1-like [Mercenaria mercenaria]XP_053379728.1 beta-1,3-galactosyltransferase 1-like [Mercenaria mercenaria]
MNESRLNRTLVVLIIYIVATLMLAFKISSIPQIHTQYHRANKHVNRTDDHEASQQTHVCDPISNVLTKSVKPDPNIRETTCNCCFQHNYDYLINNRNICKTSQPDQDIDLFMMIFTEHSNFEKRQAIRQTWLTIAKGNTANVRYVFLLGKVNDDLLTKNIAQENILYRDILKEDFIDTYKNQTLKTIMGFKWIANYCRTAKYVMKSDDDTFINVPNILNYIKNSGKGLQTQLVGSCRNDGPIRELDSKWYASEQDYKQSLYPWHCSGTGYFTSFKMIEKIYKISQYVPFFWIEDIYVSLCFRKIGGTVKNVKGFYRSRQMLYSCLYKGDKLFTSHKVTPEMVRQVWNAKCKTAKYK